MANREGIIGEFVSLLNSLNNNGLAIVIKCIMPMAHANIVLIAKMVSRVIVVQSVGLMDFVLKA